MSVPASTLIVSRQNYSWFSRVTRNGWLGFAGFLCLATAFAQAAEGKISKEYQLKAAFLYNFTKFVEWPRARFPNETSPVVIGVLGRNPFDAELANVVNGRTLNGHPIVVRLVATAEEVRQVHLLFVPAGEESRLPANAWQNSSIVSVGESDAFADLGGTITFMQQDDKLRFAINVATAERDGLKLSAQLLKLAASVRRQL